MRTDQSPTYDLSTLLDVPALTDVAPGTNILVSGPAMTGKDTAILETLAAGLAEGDGIVVLTTNGTTSELLGALESRVDDPDWSRVSVMDCRSEGDREERTTETGASVHHVSTPADFTELGVGILRSFDDLKAMRVDRARFGLMSLSTMLNYADRQAVFKFCHVISSHLDTTGYIGLFTVDSTAHDTQILEVLSQAFDARIEIEEADGDRRARVMGLEAEPSNWVTL